jgi:protein-S-isoprenylcysteine O-methyltransferase Ste14
MVPAVDPAQAAGLTLAAVGLSLSLWAAVQLRLAGAPHVLVEEGPYRFSRNPMALGLAAVLAGLPLTAGVPALALAAPAYLAWARRVRIPAEEARLKQHFGGWYSDYAAQVRRWI